MMQVSGGQGGGEVKKSEEIPSRFLGAPTQDQGGEEGPASKSRGKGAPPAPAGTVMSLPKLCSLPGMPSPI